MSLTAKHVDSIRPFLTQTLADALKAGSGSLDTFNSMLQIAQRTGDASLVAQVESRIKDDSKTVKEAFAGALVEVCKAVDVPVVLKGADATQGKRRGRKPGSKNKPKPE
jgi:hypothetical protein